MDELGVPTNESYFADEFLGYSIGTGIFWLIGTLAPIICQEYWLKPASDYGVGDSLLIAWDYVEFEFSSTIFIYPTAGLTLWTRIAWMAMSYGSAAIFGLLTISWLLAYIKKPWFQKAYYMSASILTIISWVLSLFVAAALTVGGLVTDNETAEPKRLAYNMIYLAVYTVGVIVVDLIVFLGMGEGLVKFYKWDEQEWWGGNDQGEEDIDVDDVSDPFAL